jgi:hypothetical protein
MNKKRDGERVFLCYYLHNNKKETRKTKEKFNEKWRKRRQTIFNDDDVMFYTFHIQKVFQFEWKWGRESRWMSSKICFWLRQTMLLLSSSLFFFFAIKYIAHKINDSGASGKCVIVVPRVRALINLPKEWVNSKSCENKTHKKKLSHCSRFLQYFSLIFRSPRFRRFSFRWAVAASSRQKSFMTNSNLSVKYWTICTIFSIIHSTNIEWEKGKREIYRVEKSNERTKKKFFFLSFMNDVRENANFKREKRDKACQNLSIFANNLW